MEDSVFEIEEYQLCPAASILLQQINKRWPDRDKEFDNSFDDQESSDVANTHSVHENGNVYALDIDTRIGPKGKMREGLVADELANQIIDYAKNSVPGSERIESVAYKNKIASGEFKDRFWVWRSGNYGCIQHIHITFKKLGYEDPRNFQLPIFNTRDEDPELFKPKEKAEIPKYPGKDRLSFGKKNESVRKMQRQLLAKNYSLPLGDTAEYDEQTRAAVRLLYHKMRKNSSGKDVGPAAWNFLFGE
jgi:hypothetical protein